jgi:hypothetical protein
VKYNVNTNVKSHVKTEAGSWPQALRDAEEGIRKANQEVADWKATAAICRRMIAKGAPWPGTVIRLQPTQSSDQSSKAATQC